VSRGRVALACAGALCSGAAAQAPPPDPVAQPAYIAPLASKALLLDGARAGWLLVVVGERGIALASRDGGETWTQGEVPVRSTLTGVHLHDESLGWAVGHDSTILRTEDGGATWRLLAYAPEELTPLLDVWFADATRGFAVGAYGRFLATTDGGDTWETVDFVATPYASPDAGATDAAPPAEDAGDAEDEFEVWDDEGPLDYHLNQIVAAPSGRLYIAAEAGHVFRSDDGGATWVSLPSPYAGSFFGALPLDGEQVLVVGLRGHAFRSGDGGLTWTAIDTGTTATLNQALRLDDGTILIGGLAGTLLRGAPDAAALELHESPDRLGTSALVIADAGHVLLIGEGGVRRTPLAALPGGTR
jgi:photosystem II stability/assembly factor-like uncharacterized protein